MSGPVLPVLPDTTVLSIDTVKMLDEPDEAKHLRSLIEWVGADRLLFSSDYPHWDFDDPRFAFKTPLTEPERRKIFNGNARALYKL